MTAVLDCAAVVTSGADRPLHLTAAGARRLTDEIRHHLGTAIVKLQAAREGGAHEVLGYPSWHAYVEAEFGDLRELRLPVVERRALAQSMHDGGMSYRQIRDKLDVSLGTIRNDIGSPVIEGEVVQLHSDPDPDPFEGMSRADEVVARVRAQGDRGLTCRELVLESGLHHGQASGALSRVARQGRVLADGRFRAGYGVYVAGGAP